MGGLVASVDTFLQGFGACLEWCFTQWGVSVGVVDEGNSWRAGGGGETLSAMILGVCRFPFSKICDTV